MARGSQAGEAASFGDLLRRYRAVVNQTQEQLAERSGLSAEAVSALERGVRRTPRVITIELLSQALALSPYDRREFMAAARQGRSVDPSRPPEPRAGIPPDPIVHFVGREAELAELGRGLEKSGHVAVHGLGGVGKTQLVTRYLHQRRADYPAGVFWLRADEESSLAGDLASVAWHLALPERDLPEQERQIAAVLRWLREHDRWLLVLDNLEPTAQEAMGRWLPPGLPGHLLLTSRMPMWAVRLALKPLPKETARQFLLQRTGQDDAKAAGAVAEALGRLPLALAQAAGYLEVTGRDLASYAELLRTRLVELMGESEPDDHPRPVATTWRLSFERLECERPAAADLLRLCAFLAPDDIPIGVLQSGAREMSEPLRGALADDLELDRTVAALHRFSLVERSGDGLRVHRLVQAVVREPLGLDERDSWLSAAIRLLRDGFPDDAESPENWPLCGRLVAHVRFAEQMASGRRIEPQALSWLLQRASIYLRARGELGMSSLLCERALAIRQEVLGPEHIETADSVYEMGWLLAQRGELPAAKLLLERALVVRERVLAPGHPDIASSLNSLAYVLRGQGRMEAARALLERAVAIYERARGSDHPDTACSLNNLAFLVKEQGELAVARPLQERAVGIFERVLGPDHPDTALSLDNLAALLQEQGEASTARPLFERALTIRTRVLGADHPQTARTLFKLARLLREQNETAAALPMMERAFALCERGLGPDHPRTVECRLGFEEISAEMEQIRVESPHADQQPG